MKYDQHNPYTGKVPFYETITKQTFVEQSAYLHPKKNLAVSSNSLRPKHFKTPLSYTTLRSMNPRPNITSYPVCIEDGGGNGGKSGFG